MKSWVVILHRGVYIHRVVVTARYHEEAFHEATWVMKFRYNEVHDATVKEN